MLSWSRFTLIYEHLKIYIMRAVPSFMHVWFVIHISKSQKLLFITFVCVKWHVNEALFWYMIEMSSLIDICQDLSQYKINLSSLKLCSGKSPLPINLWKMHLTYSHTRRKNQSKILESFVGLSFWVLQTNRKKISPFTHKQFTLTHKTSIYCHV